LHFTQYFQTLADIIEQLFSISRICQRFSLKANTIYICRKNYQKYFLIIYKSVILITIYNYVSAHYPCFLRLSGLFVSLNCLIPYDKVYYYVL